MKNSKLRRVLMLLACAVLLVSLSVGATLAYLTSVTPLVQNTFSVGNVSFDQTETDDGDDETVDEVAIAGGLDETKVNVFGDRDTTATSRVTANTYKIMPAHQYTKDPVVHIAEESEPVWVFVRIQNPITAIEAAVVEYGANTLTTTGEQKWIPHINGTVHEQIDGNGWTLIAGDTTDGVYAFDYIANPDDDVTTFFAFAIQGDLEYKDISGYAGAAINVQAYIVQADGFTSATAAYEAAPCTGWPVIAATETPDAGE